MLTNTLDGPVPEHLVGEAWPAVQPGADPVLLGHAKLDPSDPVTARSAQTFTLTYTVGRYGLDDTGAIRVAFRAMTDFGRLQVDDPAAPGYVSAQTSGKARIDLDYAGFGVASRPRWRALTARVRGGYLREGDTITIVFGDTSGGSPGMKMQTFVEGGFEFKVLADVCASGHFTPIVDTPSVAIVPGAPAVWRAVLSSLRRPGEPFRFGLKAEDAWGNPTPLAEGDFAFETTLPVNGLPERYRYERGNRSVVFDGLTVDRPGLLRIAVRDAAGAAVAESHPMMVREGAYAGYWGDLHGQSGESIGVTTAEQYFDFARNKAVLDVTSHQANDFQVNNAFWAHINTLTARQDEPGTFVTFPATNGRATRRSAATATSISGRKAGRSAGPPMPCWSTVRTSIPTRRTRGSCSRRSRARTASSTPMSAAAMPIPPLPTIHGSKRRWRSIRPGAPSNGC